MDPLESLKRRVEEARDNLVERIASGAAKSYEDYKYMLGMREAYDRVLGEIRETAARYIED